MAAPEFDYVIVGAGTAGCLLANRLSADPAKRVLLLEAGGRDNWHWIHIPVGYLYCIGNPRTDWLYKTEPDAGLNGRVLRYPPGRTHRGCSSINGMIYMRGQARDYEHWAHVTGDTEWTWDNCLPDFKALVMSAVPGLQREPALVRQFLTQSATAVSSTSCSSAGVPNNLYGSGRLNALAAVQSAQAWWVLNGPVFNNGFE